MTRFHSLSRDIVLMLGLVTLTACSVQQEGEEVAVRHVSTQEIVGKWEAEKKCTELGKVAKLLKVAPVKTEASTLYLRTKTSTYKCVESLNH